MKSLPRVNSSDLAYLNGQVWNDSADAIEKSDRLTVAAPLTMSESATQKTIGAGLPIRQILTVKITGQDSDDPSRFSWAESRRNASTEGWEELDNGRIGTIDDDPCFMLDESSVEDLTDEHVAIARVPVYNDDDQLTDGWLILRGSTLPVGEFQYMLFGNVSQNQTGFDFARACPPLPST